MKTQRLLWQLATSLAITVNLCTAAWPNGPFKTDGRWITDASGINVTLVGANWPGHEEAMIPEGLQHLSIADIVGKFKDLGMNAVRLTYAIEMIDQLKDHPKDVTIEKALVDAIGQKNATAVLEKITKNNPAITAKTKRFEVWDAVAAECAKQEIYILLDNHVSKAGWCCSPIDGNSWWGDTHFSVANWTNGLAYMANYSKTWPAVVAMSLRNELRQPLNNLTLFRESYNWQTWYTHTQSGAAAIHAANPSPLIFLTGMDASTTFTPIILDAPLPPSTTTHFNLSDFSPYQSKLVLDMHTYSILPWDQHNNCSELTTKLFTNGFATLTAPNDKATVQFPLVMSEWGFDQNGTAWNTTVYATCLREYLPAQKVGWFIWVMAGSYYTREGVADNDEGWGLLAHDWQGWRDEGFVEGALRGMVNETLEGVSREKPGGGEDGDGSDGGDDEGSGNGDGNGSDQGEGGGAGTDAGNSAAGILAPASLGLLIWAGMCAVSFVYI